MTELTELKSEDGLLKIFIFIIILQCPVTFPLGHDIYISIYNPFVVYKDPRPVAKL